VRVRCISSSGEEVANLCMASLVREEWVTFFVHPKRRSRAIAYGSFQKLCGHPRYSGDEIFRDTPGLHVISPRVTV